jgi:outer membrane translocation and assembly module TamA
VKEGEILDRAAFVARAEYRFALLQDLDVDIFTTAWLRTIQLVAFFDAGEVAEKLERVFRAPRRWKLGTGFGVRLHADAAGVVRWVIRCDVGFRLDKSETPQFYVGVNQAF